MLLLLCKSYATLVSDFLISSPFHESELSWPFGCLIDQEYHALQHDCSQHKIKSAKVPNMQSSSYLKLAPWSTDPSKFEGCDFFEACALKGYKINHDDDLTQAPRSQCLNLKANQFISKKPRDCVLFRDIEHVSFGFPLMFLWCSICFTSISIFLFDSLFNLVFLQFSSACFMSSYLLVFYLSLCIRLIWFSFGFPIGFPTGFPDGFPNWVPLRFS